MYCQYCGNEVDENAVFCSKCGAKLKNDSPAPAGERDEFFNPAPSYQQPTYQQPVYQQPVAPNTTNTMAIVGFIFSFFFAIVGLICSIIGYKQCNQTKEGGKGLALAGIIISAVSMALAFIIVMIVFSYALIDPPYYY